VPDEADLDVGFTLGLFVFLDCIAADLHGASSNFRVCRFFIALRVNISLEMIIELVHHELRGLPLELWALDIFPPWLVGMPMITMIIVVIKWR